MEKVILISVDGLRPDGFLACGNPYIDELMKKAFYTLNGKTYPMEKHGFLIDADFTVEEKTEEPVADIFADYNKNDDNGENN